jgi:formate C-acetyltransferase
MLKTGEEIEKFGAGIETYFECGSLHIQCNIMFYEMLLDAKETPEKYPQLLVRVSGYSACFKDLNDTMKEKIITRSTAHDLRNGSAMPFPRGPNGKPEGK